MEDPITPKGREQRIQDFIGNKKRITHKERIQTMKLPESIKLSRAEIDWVSYHRPLDTYIERLIRKDFRGE